MTHISLPSCYFEPWLNYQQPCVRQLAFSIASPNILTQLPPELVLKHHFELHDDLIWQQHYTRYIPRLEALDQNPTELLDFIHQLKSTRLGLRFEMLIWFWLLDRDYHHYELIGHSIQKIDGPKTLGELDFVLRNLETQEIEHWEIALKYYLAESDSSLPSWYGLNRSDTLSRKLNHFTQKQFQFDDALEHHIQRKYCMLKGQLYLPAHKPNDLPHWVNPARRIGHWGHHIPHTTEQYYRLQRHEWICAHAERSSAPAEWWTDGLYKQSNQENYYMYRQPNLLQTHLG
jgi:uncharacterized protein